MRQEMEIEHAFGKPRPAKVIYKLQNAYNVVLTLSTVTRINAYIIVLWDAVYIIYKLYSLTIVTTTILCTFIE